MRVDLDEFDTPEPDVEATLMEVAERLRKGEV